MRKTLRYTIGNDELSFIRFDDGGLRVCVDIEPKEDYSEFVGQIFDIPIDELKQFLNA